jgi:hypothetical protein
MKRSILSECLRRAREKHGPSHPSWEQKAVHYSFIVQNNKILEMGMNRPDASPPLHYGYPSHADIHSEIDAWRKARGILEDGKWEIVNIKLSKEASYRVADAAPCIRCQILLISLGCTGFYFTTSTKGFAKIIH